MTQSRRRRLLLAGFSAAVGGAGLTWIGLILVALALDGHVAWVLRDSVGFAVGGAVAGCLALGMLALERRCRPSLFGRFLGGLSTYYLGVLACWSVAIAIEGPLRSTSGGAGFGAWLHEIVRSAPAILAIATVPFGLITIPLCFLLRWWIGRLLGAAPSAPAKMGA